jgi:MFS family permease
MGAGMLAAPLTSEPWHLYATLGVLVGGGSVCLGYAGQSLFLPNWFVRRRGLALSIAFAGVGIGAIIMLPLVQQTIAQFGWRAACRAIGLLILVVLCPINLLLRKRPEDLGLLPDGDGEPGATEVAAQSRVVDAAWVAVDWTLPRALATRRFWWIALGYFCALYVWYAVQVHQTKYLLEIGFDRDLSAWALGLVSLVGIPGQIVLGHLSDRIGREWVWAIASFGFLLCFVLLIALQYSPAPPLLYLMVAAQGLLGYGITSVLGAIVAEIFQGRRYGSIFGSLMVLALIGAAAGPWVTGLLHDRLGGYTLAFAIAAGLSGLSALAIWRASPREVRAVAGRARTA